MLCPDCKKEVELLKIDPQVSRVRLDDTVVRAVIEVSELCAECSRFLQASKMDVERDVKDVPSLKGHLKHKWHVELLKAERISEPIEYASVKIYYGLTCECGQLPMYEGTILGSSKLLPSP